MAKEVQVSQFEMDNDPVDEYVEAALRSSLTGVANHPIVDYLVALVMEEVVDAQSAAATNNTKSKKVKKVKSTFDLASRAIENALLASEADLELKTHGISAVIEAVLVHLHGSFHPPPSDHVTDNLGFDVGATCMAILAEDDSWHEAVVVSFDASECTVEVCFVEFGNVQVVGLSSVVLADNVLTDDAADVCAMCERCVPLTEHHLIPRQVHTRYLKRGFTREYLSRCIDICRACHSNIHSHIDNRTLADDFNTLEKLLAHDAISKYVAYARKQKARIKPMKK
ncbi:hypothetical protein DYB28_010343 [Aphanomyces astaci]|uniref:Tudor domain-containing protein n=1 Tax=Aphanomyces astaci TaxID=112090 RepID=A0A9X8H3I5_APHAT|nr:hypothetical protein DYB28_010343 [Aphanomyces astaci]